MNGLGPLTAVNRHSSRAKKIKKSSNKAPQLRLGLPGGSRTNTHDTVGTLLVVVAVGVAVRQVHIPRIIRATGDRRRGPEEPSHRRLGDPVDRCS